jgi:hypothetical protein
MEKDFRPMLEELNGRWLPAVLSGTAPLAEVALVQEEPTAEEIDVTVMDVYSIDETIPVFVEGNEVWNTWDNTIEYQEGDEYLYMMNTIGDETDPWLDESLYLEDGGEWIDPAVYTISPELFRNNKIDPDLYFEEYNQTDDFSNPQIYYMASSTAIVRDQDNSSAQLLSALDTPANVDVQATSVTEVSVTFALAEATKPASGVSEHTDTSVTPVPAVATPNINPGLTLLTDNRLSISLV